MAVDVALKVYIRNAGTYSPWPISWGRTKWRTICSSPAEGVLKGRRPAPPLILTIRCGYSCGHANRPLVYKYFRDWLSSSSCVISNRLCVGVKKESGMSPALCELAGHLLLTGKYKTVGLNLVGCLVGINNIHHDKQTWTNTMPWRREQLFRSCKASPRRGFSASWCKFRTYFATIYH